MGPATNWLSFSLSPMEMLRSSESQFMGYENSSTDSPHYLIDNFYENGKNLNFIFLFFSFSICKTIRSCLVAEKEVSTFIEGTTSCYGFCKVFVFLISSTVKRND